LRKAREKFEEAKKPASPKKKKRPLE